MSITRPFTLYREVPSFTSTSTTLPRLTPFFNEHSAAATYIEGFFDPVAFHYKLSKTQPAPYPSLYQPTSGDYPEHLYTLVRVLPLIRKSVTRMSHANPLLVTVKEINPSFGNKIKYLTGETKDNYEENLAGLCVASVQDYKELAHFLYFAGYAEASSNPASSNPASSNPASSNPASSNPASSNPASSNPAYPVAIPAWMQRPKESLEAYPAHHTVTAMEALAEWYRIPGVTQPVEFIAISLPEAKGGPLVAKAYTKPFTVGLDKEASSGLLSMRVRRARARLMLLGKELTINFKLPMYVSDSRTPYSFVNPYQYRESAGRLDPYYRKPLAASPGESTEPFLDTLLAMYGEVPVTLMSHSRRVYNCYGLPVRYWSLVLDYYPTRYLLDAFFEQPNEETFTKLYLANQILARGYSLANTDQTYDLDTSDSQLVALLEASWGQVHLEWLYANLIRFI